MEKKEKLTLLYHGEGELLDAVRNQLRLDDEFGSCFNEVESASSQPIQQRIRAADVIVFGDDEDWAESTKAQLSELLKWYNAAEWRLKRVVTLGNSAAAHSFAEVAFPVIQNPNDYLLPVLPGLSSARAGRVFCETLMGSQYAEARNLLSVETLRCDLGSIWDRFWEDHRTERSFQELLTEARDDPYHESPRTSAVVFLHQLVADAVQRLSRSGHYWDRPARIERSSEGLRPNLAERLSTVHTAMGLAHALRDGRDDEELQFLLADGAQACEAAFSSEQRDLCLNSGALTYVLLRHCAALCTSIEGWKEYLGKLKESVRIENQIDGVTIEWTVVGGQPNLLWFIEPQKAEPANNLWKLDVFNPHVACRNLLEPFSTFIYGTENSRALKVSES